ncbi:hypothetical protein [Gordonia paraffinivorans]|uniref:hypothetical protein n=1 Tax=Gordonia paraffinivorans TaxID=175628 RepID=UPI0024327D03|nr:hypothetical protein [Gordonia paraffinivorans]
MGNGAADRRHLPTDTGHRAGTDRRTVWVLAVLASVLVLALVIGILYVFTTRRAEDDRAEPTPVTVTRTSTPPAPPSTPPPPAAPAPTPEQAGSVPVEGGPCHESEARSFATAANGTSLVCVYMGAGGGFRWSQHAENDGSVHNIGDPCDLAVDRVAQDPSGKAIMCGGDTWVGGP